MSTLCIIPSGSKKIWSNSPDAGPTPANHVYIGPFATKCREYAETFYPSSWCVLSAKYGFLFPDDIVPDAYEVTFNDRKTNPISEQELLVQVGAKGLTAFAPIVVLGGKSYVGLVETVLGGKTLHTPLSSCTGIGYMMSALATAIREGKPL